MESERLISFPDVIDEPKKEKKLQVFKPYEQHQEFLLPKSSEDYISKYHIARVISNIVDRIDINFIYDTYQGGGSSAYNPRMLLKVWLLGYVMRIYSSRKLALAMVENLSFMWISGQKVCNFKTLNNFRLKLKKEMKLIFKEVVLIGLEVGLVKGENVFLDHTTIESNANPNKMIWRKNTERRLENIDKELDVLFEYIDKLNVKEDELYGESNGYEVKQEKLESVNLSTKIDMINELMKDGKLSKEEGKKSKLKIKRVQTLKERKEKYEKQKEILGERNSYSKTDTDASAMKVKRSEDIKSSYNEGVTCENNFVTGYTVSQNASDNVSIHAPIIKH